MRLLLACFVALGCQPGDSFEWDLPSGFPEPRVPDDNEMSEVKVELGRHLFYDTRLSGNQTQSCASCHVQELAFTDGLALSVGSTGEVTPRGSMTIANVGYAATLTWASPVLRHLEDQALVPIFGEEPVELGMSGRENELLMRLREEPRYQEMFPLAFPRDDDPFTIANIVRALGAWQRTVISGDSAYDRFAAGDSNAISEDAKRGGEIFFEEDAECFHCHGGFAFASGVDHSGNVFDQALFANNGLYNIDGRGAYPASNQGLIETTGERQDMGKFKPPTLRNITLTAPYMHDGSLETLDEVLDMYAAGGLVTDEGENVGDGRENPHKSLFVNGFELSDDVRRQLNAFFESLRDERFLTNPALSDPWVLPWPNTP
ncbi:MAG: MbnH family di-heme enzyme [Myxococcota bacterium]